MYRAQTLDLHIIHRIEFTKHTTNFPKTLYIRNINFTTTTVMNYRSVMHSKGTCVDAVHVQTMKLKKQKMSMKKTKRGITIKKRNCTLEWIDRDIASMRNEAKEKCKTKRRIIKEKNMYGPYEEKANDKKTNAWHGEQKQKINIWKSRRKNYSERSSEKTRAWNARVHSSICIFI